MGEVSQIIRLAVAMLAIVAVISVVMYINNIGRELPDITEDGLIAMAETDTKYDGIKDIITDSANAKALVVREFTMANIYVKTGAESNKLKDISKYNEFMSTYIFEPDYYQIISINPNSSVKMKLQDLTTGKLSLTGSTTIANPSNLYKIIVRGVKYN